ncbi:hypothetical protein [Bacillus sp. SD088]|nr:hypothetical protein [Bacillus sp. SD088]
MESAEMNLGEKIDKVDAKISILADEMISTKAGVILLKKAK